MINELRKALDAALSQQEAEKPQPAGFDYTENGQFVRHFKSRTLSGAWVEKFGGEILPLYAAAPAKPADHLEVLRQEQAERVMPMIGPLLDAFESTQKRDLEELSPVLVRYLRQIELAMTGYDTKPAEQQAPPIGYLPAYELNRLESGHNANLRSAKFGPSTLDGDVPVFLGRATIAPYSAPFTADVPQCCEEPETCDEPCRPAADLIREAYAMGVRQAPAGEAPDDDPEFWNWIGGEQT